MHGYQTDSELEALDALRWAALRARVVVMTGEHGGEIRQGRRVDRAVVLAALDEVERGIRQALVASGMLPGEAPAIRRAAGG